MNTAIPVMPLVVGLMLAIGGIALIAGIRATANDPAARLRTRLGRYDGADTSPRDLGAQELARPIRERLVVPLVARASHRLLQWTPRGRSERMQARLEMAGNPGQLDSAGLLVVRVLFAVAAAALVAVVGLALALGPLTLAVAGAAAVTTFLGVDAWLWLRIRTRSRDIERLLPGALDVIAVCMEAGLGFDAALAKLVAYYRNPLGDEVARALREIRLGRPRAQALIEMAQRTGSADMRTFVQSMVQSTQMGVSAADVIKSQSDHLRGRRRSRIQVQAAQASLRMLFPTMGCIFPALWIALLGPAILTVVKLLFP